MIQFDPDNDTLITIISGIIMIALSVSMNFFPNNKIASFFLRDFLMILLLGYAFPLYFIIIHKNRSISSIGITQRKLKLSLLINILAAISLLANFISKKTTALEFTINNFYAIVYIFAAGLFEMVFIYGFLRYGFESAFGVIPSILLTSTFYSFHHAGFQPEFLKLFFVGILYSSTFYITRNIFIIFPFFWGVGAVWDVLVNSTAGNAITNFDSFMIALFLLISMIAISFVISFKAPKTKQE